MTPPVARGRSPVRKRAGDGARLVKRQIADMRSPAGVSLSRRVDAQCRQTEPAIERRLANLDGLDFVNGHDVCGATRPSAPRAEKTVGQRVAQVPVIGEADEIDERNQRERPQGGESPLNGEEKSRRHRANGRPFDYAPSDRKPRDAPPFGPFSLTGVEIREEDREHRVNGAAARYRQENVTA